VLLYQLSTLVLLPLKWVTHNSLSAIRNSMHSYLDPCSVTHENTVHLNLFS